METFSKEAVIEFLKGRAGRKYRAGELAKNFLIGVEPLREVMNELVEEGLVLCHSNSKGGSLYFVLKVPLMYPTRPVEPGVAGSLSQFIATRPFKPYVPPKGLADRCRELYPEGHSFCVKGDKS